MGTDPTKTISGYQQDKQIKKYLNNEELSPKENLFIDHYTGTYSMRTGPDSKCRPWNATQAAIFAGHPEKSAGQWASKLLKKCHIIEEVRERLSDQMKAARITAAKTMVHYAAIAYVDPGGFFNDDGTLKDIEELTEEQRLCIASIDISDDGEVSVKKIRFWDKFKGLEFCKNVLDLTKTDLKVEVTHKGEIDYSTFEPKESAELYRDLVRGDDDS